MKATFLTAALLCLQQLAQAQDPEFPKKEFVMHLKMQSGLVTNFKAAPDLFIGGLFLVPQVTIVENHLRGGIMAGFFYTNKKLEALVGPVISLKLKTFSLKSFGSGGNLNLSVDHLWGTGKQRLLGGGLNLDLLNFIVIGTSIHRDYNLNNWWLQGTVGFRISKVKKIPHP